jgi:hypothetical protein
MEYSLNCFRVLELDIVINTLTAQIIIQNEKNRFYTSLWISFC